MLHVKTFEQRVTSWSTASVRLLTRNERSLSSGRPMWHGVRLHLSRIANISGRLVNPSLPQITSDTERLDNESHLGLPLVPAFLRSTTVRCHLAGSPFDDLIVLVGQRRSGRYDS